MLRRCSPLSHPEDRDTFLSSDLSANGGSKWRTARTDHNGSFADHLVHGHQTLWPDQRNQLTSPMHLILSEFHPVLSLHKACPSGLLLPVSCYYHFFILRTPNGILLVPDKTGKEKAERVLIFLQCNFSCNFHSRMSYYFRRYAPNGTDFNKQACVKALITVLLQSFQDFPCGWLKTSASCLTWTLFKQSASIFQFNFFVNPVCKNVSLWFNKNWPRTWAYSVKNITFTQFFCHITEWILVVSRKEN